MSHKAQNNISIKNKRAFFEYEFSKVYCWYSAGWNRNQIAPQRESRTGRFVLRILFQRALCEKIMHIAEYELGTAIITSPVARKLLLSRKELSKLSKEIERKSDTHHCPAETFHQRTRACQAEIALAKGIKVYDKRESAQRKRLETRHGQGHEILNPKTKCPFRREMRT
jgi:SsrA-binding protein